MFLFKSIVISERVTIGSIQHLAPIVLVAILAFLLILYSKKLDKETLLQDGFFPKGYPVRKSKESQNGE